MPPAYVYWDGASFLMRFTGTSVLCAVRAFPDALSTPSASLVVGSPSPIGSQQLQVYTQLRPSLHRQRDFRKRSEVMRSDKTSVSVEVEGEEAVFRKKKKDRKALDTGDEVTKCDYLKAEEGELPESQFACGTLETNAKKGKTENGPVESLEAAGMLKQEAELKQELGGDKKKARKHSSRKKRTFDFI